MRGSASPTLDETREALAEEWKRRDPVDEAGISAFYRESECLGADLEAWHQTAERQEWTKAIVQVAGANYVRSVLDVGAGAGHDLRALREAFPAIDLRAVEPNQRLRRALDTYTFPAMAWPELSPDGGAPFDLVICIDVLEHVSDPDALLDSIVARIPVGGILIEASATHDQSTPLHLPEIAGWVPDRALQHAGFEVREQVGRLAVWYRVAETDTAPTVLLCAHREISVPTVECLFSLVGIGWPIALIYGDALIDRARAKAVSNWFRNERSDVFLMIDDDIVFKTEDAERVVELAREKRAIACGAYPVGDGGHLASRGHPGQRLDFNATAEPVEIRWPATGFMAVHRDVVAKMVEGLDLCYPDKPDAFWPMFTPFVLGENYLSEDYAFGERAAQLGFATWLDPKTILHHLKIQALSVHNMRGTVKETAPA
jgi:SAM-dependent methyltransferase